jgi:ATP-binding cassette subfamily B protein
MARKSGVFSDPTYRNLMTRVLRENFHVYVGRYVLAFVLMALTAAATGLTAYMVKFVTAVVFGAQSAIPEVATGKSPSRPEWLQQLSSWAESLLPLSSPGVLQLVGLAMVIVLVFAIKGASSYGSAVILAKIGNNIVARQQHRISDHLLKQSLPFFGLFPSSDLIARVSQAAAAAREVMNLLMMRVQDVLTAIALLVAMFKLDWRLSCAAIFIMAPVGLGLAGLIKRIRKIALAEYQGIIQVVSAVQESIIGNKLIKAYNLENRMAERFRTAIAAVEKRANKMASVSARSSPLMETMGGIAVACMVFYGGYRNISEPGSGGELMAFLTALLLAYEPIKRIAKMNVSMQGALVGVRMLYNVLDTDHAIPDRPDAKPLRLTRGGEIRLRGVSFAYRQDLPVLHDVTLACPGGHVTALVGPSGSGKSTILNLIERFYLPDAGVVEIDGQDLSGVTIRSLRDQMALVSQDTFLFSDTLRNNIRIVRPDATDAEVEAAARAASAHDFIMEQAQGYDTEVGENGANLSGGQRQRVSIARAFLKNAPILLLDEATSALDSESEVQIQQAFDRLMQGRTTIVIAHRFSTIRNARTIHVLDGGRLVASGTHEQLLADPDGLYTHLYRLQYREREPIGSNPFPRPT